ncbi:MAG: hypothetical protein ABI554_02330 [Flavobacterium sp.]
MSQAGFISTTSGPVPPAVPTSFVTDINSPAIPAANVLNVIGGQSVVNTVNGLRTDGSSGSNTLTIQVTNQQNDTLTTIGNTPTVLSTFTMPAVPSVQNYEYKISAYNTTDLLGAVYLIISGARTTGAAATSLNTADITTIEEGAMSGCLVAFAATGNTVTVTVTGLAAKTINWASQLKYTQVT